MKNNADIERAQLLEEIVPRLGTLHRSFAARRDEMLAKEQLSQSQLELLIMLKHGKRTVGEIAENFAITPSAVSQTVAQLEEKGLITRTADTDDRRITYIETTQKIQKQFKKMRDKFIAYMDENLRDISTQDLEILINILTRINNALDEEKLWKK
jgi:DNA-binding MarR family transcriptional regulator